MAATGALRQYLLLCKPRVVVLIVFTAVVGMLLAVPGSPPLVPMLAGTLGIALAASSAAAINHLLDARVDAKMRRTRCVVLRGNKRSESVIGDTGITLHNVPARTFLRYYEEIGLLEPAARSQGGFRYYRQTDLNRHIQQQRQIRTKITLHQLLQPGDDRGVDVEDLSAAAIDDGDGRHAYLLTLRTISPFCRMTTSIFMSPRRWVAQDRQGS